MKKKEIKRRKFLKLAAVSAASLGSLSTLHIQNGLAKSKEEEALENTKMPMRELGSTGVKIPILQQGTAQRLDQRYDKILHRCFKGGVTCFDTAISYGWGSSHGAMANFVKQIGDRKKLWITSKADEYRPEKFISGLDRCLEELETHYLDLFLMHGINDTDMLDKPYLQAGERMRRSGKTRFFGFSCHGRNVVPLMNKAAAVGGIDAILFRYNFRRYGDRELNLAIDACKKAGIGLLAMKTNGAVPDEIEQVIRFQSENFTLGQAKLKSVWADERIDSIVTEMDSVRVTRENITAAKSEKPLLAEEVHQLNQLAALTSQYHCNGCSQICESLFEEEVAIADSLRFLMYYESYGKEARAKELYRNLPAKKEGFDSRLLAKASKLCPQNIDLRVQLERASSVLV